jgi:PAS domain S-box-containing protein
VTNKAIPFKNGPGNLLWRCVIAVLSVLGGLGLRGVFAGVLGSTVPYITLFPAVMFAAWFGGLGPGILAALLSVTAAFYLLIPHSPSLAPADAAGGILFFAVAVFISVLNEGLRRARRKSDERFQLLALETAQRSRAEENLAESKREAERSRDFLLTTLASIGDAVITTDSQGKITFLNFVAQELTGWNSAEATGKDISDVFVIVHETTRQPALCPVAAVLRDGAIATLANHTVLITKDGREIPIEDTAAPVREQQRLVGVVLVFRDVTSHRNAENTLKHSEESLKLALDAGQIGVWDWDVSHNRIRWSDRVYDIHGVEHGTFAGGVEDYATLIHPEDRDRIVGEIGAAVAGQARYDVAFRIVQGNGNVRWVSTTARVFRDESGQPLRMLGATTDVTAREQALASLRQQWRIFDSALSNSPDFIYVFDLDGRFTYCNRALLSLLQKPLDYVVGRNFSELEYPPELAARLQRQIQQVITSKEPLRDHTPFTGPTGETGHYEYIFVPITGTDGHVEAVVGSTRDITDRIRSEEDLRKSEERLTLALEAGGGVGTWDWDIQQDRVYANSRFATLFSVDPERAAAGVPLAEFTVSIHEDDRVRLNESIGRALESGEEFAEEYRITQPDGIARWIYAHGRCHRNENGQAVRFPGVLFDITERKQAEETLRQSQDRLRAIYDGTYEYLGLLAPDGTLLEANRASLEFAGNTRDEVVGRPYWEAPWFALTPQASELVREGVAQAAAGNSVRYEVQLLRPTGETPTLYISLHPIFDESGQVVLIVPEGQDITERKRAEEGLRRTNEELTRANRELEEFAYVSSHDLQEPLRMVNIYTQLLLRRALAQEGLAHDENLQTYADFIRKGVHRMEELIKDLLAYSRVVHREQEAAHPADLNQSLDEAISTLAVTLEETGAILLRSPLPLVWGEQRQLAQVFQNLLSNALKYRQEGIAPHIEIGAEKCGDEWVVSVRDNGIGFDPEHSERIFGLFKRLHKDAYPGTGLGLAICKRIVERYGGRIRAKSAGEGHGAVFSFSLRGSG